MTNEKEILESRCDFFKDQNRTSDIFKIIENAIIFAASYHPEEFKLRRDSIAETLFSKKLNHVVCSGDDVDLSDDKKDVRIRTYHEVDMKEKQALSDTIDEDIKLWIMGGDLNKEEILRKSTKGDGKLVLMNLIKRIEEFDDYTVDGLKAATIGLLLYELKTLGSEQIRLLARSVVHRWIDMGGQQPTQKGNKEEAKKTNNFEHIMKKKQATGKIKCIDDDGSRLLSSEYFAKGNINDEKKNKGSEPIMKKEALKKPLCADDATSRLECARKRLRDRYQEANNAKKQRRIQVVEFQKLPRQNLNDTRAGLKRRGLTKNKIFRCLRV